jgi:hypothetical protein
MAAAEDSRVAAMSPAAAAVAAYEIPVPAAAALNIFARRNYSALRTKEILSV